MATFATCFCPGSKNNFLSKIFKAGLTNHDLVLSRKE